MTHALPDLVLDEVTQFVSVADSSPSVSVIWDRAVQAAVVEEAPGPTIASRAYAIVHAAVFEAWAAYDPLAIGPVTGDALAADGTLADQETAMSYAAFAALIDLFPDQRPAFDAVMEGLSLTPEIESALFPEGSPEVVGLGAGGAVVADRADDGANQSGGYADTTAYAPVNAGPLDIVDITRWTPENVPIDPEEATPDQSFLTPQWGTVRPFGFEDPAAFRPPAPEPFFVEGVAASLDLDPGTVTLDGETVPVTPDLVGPVINPGFIAQAEEVIDFSAVLTDEQKLVAEFWEDAGGTSFPPGTWMTFGQFVSAREDHGTAEDARMFFALGNAVMDAGIASWEAKVFHDYTRPVRAIRDLGELGLVGAPGTDALTGEEGFVIEAYAGPEAGTATVLADNFVTYQTPGADASPPFAEYTSGHSAFSAAGAAVLRAFSDSDAFGASVLFPAGSSRFEPGTTPAEDLTLSWPTFRAAADEAGISRLYGGIHFEDGDLEGRTLGTAVGEAAVLEAMSFIGGGAELPEEAPLVALHYEALLYRRAESEGLSWWIGQAEPGVDPVALARAFLRSAEFAAITKDTPEVRSDGAALVAYLVDALDLDPAAIETDDTVLGQIEAGASPADGAAAFLASSEIADAAAGLSTLYETSEGVFDFA